MLSKELSNDLVLVDVAHAYNLDCQLFVATF